MKLTTVIGIACLSAGIVTMSYYLSSRNASEKRLEQDAFSKTILANVAGDDGVLEDSDKQSFVRYLGYADAIKSGEELAIVPAQNGKGYDVYAGKKKLGNVQRAVLEAYFPGREKF